MDEDARKIRLLDWLTATPEIRKELGWPDSLNKLAADIGVTPRSLRNWRAEPAFRARWEKQAKDIIGDPSKVQEILEEMRQLGLERTIQKGTDAQGNPIYGQNTQQVAAAKTYLLAVEGIKPPAIDMAKKKASEMSDAELAALLEQERQRAATASEPKSLVTQFREEQV